MKPRAVGEAIADLEAVAPMITRHAEASERAAELHPETVHALIEARLFRLWLPHSLGGDELALPDALRVIEAAAQLDGSAGWAVQIGAGGGLFAAYLDPGTAAELFGPPEAVIAGSGRPTGRAVDRGSYFEVDGGWSYASGACYATWFTANCIVEAAGQTRARDHDAPSIRALTFPARDVEIVGSWSAPGLRATGSHDFAVRAARVPLRFSFDLAGTPREPGALHRYPFASLAEVAFAAVGLGIGGHALDAFRSSGEGRPGTSPQPLASPGARARYGEAEVTLRAARLLLDDAVKTSWERVAAGHDLVLAERASVRLAAVHAVRSAARAIDLLYEVSGTSALRIESEFGRCWRDVHALAQHVALSPLGYEEAGGALLEGAR